MKHIGMRAHAAQAWPPATQHDKQQSAMPCPVRCLYAAGCCEGSRNTQATLPRHPNLRRHSLAGRGVGRAEKQ